MNRSAKILCKPFLLSLLLASAQVFAQPGTSNAMPRAETTIIYKHVDESGRVTYANSPIKGGVRVDLEPITVIPSTPSGSLNAANAQAIVPAASPKAVAAVPAVPTQASTPAAVVASVKAPVAVATVLPVSNSAQAQTSPIVAPARIMVASLDSMTQLTQQRQAETRRRILEGELQTEEDMLVASRAKLDEERQLSNGIRAMRVSFAASPDAVTPQKPLMTPESRAEIERHFERVRNLQDEVAMHENHLQGLREQLASLK